MRKYHALCLDPIPRYSRQKIRALRQRNHISQAVLATVLNTSLSTVRQWEIGAKQPSDPSLKLLHLLDRKGLEALI
jgi:putative transcriptional regulator